MRHVRGKGHAEKPGGSRDRRFPLPTILLNKEKGLLLGHFQPLREVTAGNLRRQILHEITDCCAAALGQLPREDQGRPVFPREDAHLHQPTFIVIALVRIAVVVGLGERQPRVEPFRVVPGHASSEEGLHIPLIFLTVFWRFLALLIGCRCPTILALQGSGFSRMVKRGVKFPSPI